MVIRNKALINSLKKIEMQKRKNNLLLKKNTERIIFAKYSKKKINQKYLDSFWKKYFDGSLKSSILKREDVHIISRYNPKVKIFALSPSVAVTIRKTVNGKEYLEIKNYFENKFKQENLKHSNIVFADIVDYKKKGEWHYIMERIIPSLTVLDLLHYSRTGVIHNTNRYQKSFLKKIKKMDVKAREKMYIDLRTAIAEFDKVVDKIKREPSTTLDYAESNLIIIDYNPISGKFKFGIIDIKGIYSRSL